MPAKNEDVEALYPVRRDRRIESEARIGGEIDKNIVIPKVTGTLPGSEPFNKNTTSGQSTDPVWVGLRNTMDAGSLLSGNRAEGGRIYAAKCNQ